VETATERKEYLWWPDLLVLGLAAAAGAGLFALAEGRIAGAWGFPLDDAWIHLQLARNLSAGQGLSLNPGEPAAASTAPLWTLVLAFLHRLPWNPILAVKILGAILLLVNGWLARGLARTAGLEGRWPLLAGLAVVLTPRLLWASLSGMEVMLYAALATAGAGCHMRSWGGTPSMLGTGLLALAALARPECLILFPLAVLDRWRLAARMRILARLYWKHALLYAALLAPFVWFNCHAIGKPLPNTFYAKVGGYGLVGALQDLSLSRIARAALLYPVLQAREVAQFSAENSVLLTCLVPLGLLGILRPRKKGEPPVSWLIPLVVVGFPLIRGALAPFKGATFQHGRYAGFLVPLLGVAGLLGLRGTWQVLRQGLTLPQAHRLRSWGVAAAWALVLMELLVVDLKYARTYAWNVENINEMHVAMGKWLAAHTAPEAVVATNDIGAIAYFSQRRLLDIVGLATPEVLDFLEPGVPADQGVWRFLHQEKPDYLVILPNWYPELAQMREHFQPVHEILLENNTIAGGNRLVAFRTGWADE